MDNLSEKVSKVSNSASKIASEATTAASKAASKAATEASKVVNDVTKTVSKIKPVYILASVILLAVVVFLIYWFGFRKPEETFYPSGPTINSHIMQTPDQYDDPTPTDGGADQPKQPSPQSLGEPVASEQIGTNEVFKPLDPEDNENVVPGNCYPKQKMLTAEELLPSECDNTWAQSNPVVPGSLNTQNFLNAGHHIGLNTVGQSLRNANMQLRSEPPNPQIKVCPWNQSTIEADIGRKGLEIGTGC